MTDALPDNAVTGASPAVTATMPSIIGLELQAGKTVPRRRVIAWAFWDWGGAAFNSVTTTFVFTVYLTSSYFIAPHLRTAVLNETNTHGPAHLAAAAAEAPLSSGLAWGLGIAGMIVALIAPVLGQRSDASGRRKLWLGINTAVVVLMMALMFFVQGQPNFFYLGVLLVAIGTVFFEIATVNYNAMLIQVSTPKSVGKVSGLGWASGYLGGIVLLLFVLLGLVGLSAGSIGFFGVSHDDGLNIRIIAVIAAAWTLVFSIPIFVSVPEIPVENRRDRVGFFASYLVLFKDVATLWRESRNTVWFLIASALFRDGLVGVFTFGGILAAGTFGFTETQVITFAIAANVVAGISTLLSGLFDDRFGPKPVIVVSLVGLILAGTAVFFLHDAGQLAFWVCGLILRAVHFSREWPQPHARVRSTDSMRLPAAASVSLLRSSSACSSAFLGRSTGAYSGSFLYF
jgi:MFS transporter, UMF1 family